MSHNEDTKHEKYNKLFELLENILQNQEEQKKRGLNDFNLLTTVLKYHDEVRLHSRMIGKLLDPNGKHYQGSLFLEVFLEKLDLKNWGMDLSNTTVQIEYKDIDLYITDGNKHLIIENKIWAADQPCQIMKYINIIVEENSDQSLINKEARDDSVTVFLDKNLLRVVYLTPRKKDVPDEHGRDGEYIYYTGSDDQLKKCSKRNNTELLVPNGLKKYKAKYQKVGYINVILPWLIQCRKEIRNITNLNESIGQYIDVVKRVNGNYQGNVMIIEEELLKKTNKEKLFLALELDKRMNKIKRDVLVDFFDNLSKKLEEKSYSDLTEIILPKENRFYGKHVSKNYGLVFDCDFKNNKYLFVKVAKYGLYYGVICSDQINDLVKRGKKLEKFYYCDDEINKILNPKHEKCAKHFGDIRALEKLIEPNEIFSYMLDDIKKIEEHLDK